MTSAHTAELRPTRMGVGGDEPGLLPRDSIGTTGKDHAPHELLSLGVMGASAPTAETLPLDWSAR